MNFPSWLKSLGGFSTPSRFEQQPDSKNHQQNVSSGSTLSKTSHTGSKNSSDDKRSGKLKRDQPSRPLTYPRDTNLKNETQTKNLKRTRSPSGLSNERNSKQKLTCLEEQNQSSKPWLHQLFKAVGINSIQTSQTSISPSLEPILPNGWIKEIDRLGREFYVNQVTHQTSFEFPRIEDIDVKPILSDSTKQTQSVSKISIPLFRPELDREDSTQCGQDSRIETPNLDLSSTSGRQHVSQKSHQDHISLNHLQTQTSPGRTTEDNRLPAKQEAPRDNSCGDLPDTTSLLNENTRSEPASTNHKSSHFNLESFHLGLEPYDEAEEKRTRSPSGLSNERNSKQKLTCLEEQNQSSKPWLHQLFKSVGINSIQTLQTDISLSLEPILPNGWIKEIDRLGREFYVNQFTHQTSFEFPRIEDIDVKPILSDSTKQTQSVSKISIPLFCPELDREDSTQCGQDSRIETPNLNLSSTSDSQHVSQKSHRDHISLNHLQTQTSPGRTIEDNRLQGQFTHQISCERPEEDVKPVIMIPSERKKKHKRPVIIDLASDSSTEDIDPELIIDNQETCNSETPAKHEAPRDNSSVNLPDTISLLNEKTRSEPASTDHNSSHLNLESLHLELEPYDEAEDQSITPSHTQALSRFNSSSHDPNDKPGQEIQKQPVNIDKDHINLPTDIQNRSQTPSRTSTSSRTISLSLDRNLELVHETQDHQIDNDRDCVRSSVQSDLRLDYYEEMNPSETGRNEDRFLILTHLNEGSSVEELIRFVKTGEDLRKQPPKNEAVTESGPNKLPEPLKIWCDLASRGYPKSLWDFVPKSKRKYIGEKLNHGNLNQRFMIVEYQSRFQKELSYEFFKGGTNRSEILFYCGSVMVHLLDDLNDLEGCDCIYDRNPEIITCKIVREKFKRLIKTLILIGEERKRKDLKPVWQKLKKEIIEDKFKKCLNDEELMVENFDEYLKDASKVGIVRMSQVIVGKDLNQVDMLGLGEPIVHWQLMKPFRKSIEDTH